jgi:hypothetical protein
MKNLKLIAYVALALLSFRIAANAAGKVECNRECLAGFMTTNLNALVAHNSSKLPAAKNIKYTENGVRLVNRHFFSSMALVALA